MVARRLRELGNPLELQRSEFAARAREAEIELRRQLELCRAADLTTAAGREVHRVGQEIADALEVPDGWLAKAIFRWSSSTAASERRALARADALAARAAERLEAHGRVLEALRRYDTLRATYVASLPAAWSAATLSDGVEERLRRATTPGQVDALWSHIDFIEEHLTAVLGQLQQLEAELIERSRAQGGDAWRPDQALPLEQRVELLAEHVKEATAKGLAANGRLVDNTAHRQLVRLRGRLVQPRPPHSHKATKLRHASGSLKRWQELHELSVNHEVPKEIRRRQR